MCGIFFFSFSALSLLLHPFLPLSVAFSPPRYLSVSVSIPRSKPEFAPSQAHGNFFVCAVKKLMFVPLHSTHKIRSKHFVRVVYISPSFFSFFCVHLSLSLPFILLCSFVSDQSSPSVCCLVSMCMLHLLLARKYSVHHNCVSVKTIYFNFNYFQVNWSKWE